MIDLQPDVQFIISDCQCCALCKAWDVVLFYVTFASREGVAS